MSWTGSVELLNHLNSNAVVLLAGAFLLGVFFAYVYRQKRQAYLLVWAIAWMLASLPFAVYAFVAHRAFPVWLDITNEWMMAAAALAFYCSARIYARMNISTRNVVLAALLAVLWAYAYTQKWIAAPLGMGVAIIFFGAAHIFWQEGRKQESRADKLLAITFVATGILRLLLIFQQRLSPLAEVNLLPFALLAEIFGGVLMLMAVYEEERRRVERNMLALSNLNLATSSFVGGEIQKMLAQALDRVLNVVRIPAGALCLHYGDEKGPTSIVVTGMGDAFCSAIQKDSLDSYTVNLVARLGGLVVLRDLARDANWVALEKEETFQHVRKILLEQGLRTVVG
ncbi:MAG: hypothetical protein WBQ31_05435, partial [Candidatus Acidiferrales bacterium]